MPKVAKTFTLKWDQIQPSQLYVSREKLSQVLRDFDRQRPESLEPIPVRKLGKQVIFVDGHTRALAAFLRRFSEVSVYWEGEELDWELYKICVGWCKKDGIHTIADLKDRIVEQKDYETLWIKRCENAQQELEAKRKQRTL